MPLCRCRSSSIPRSRRSGRESASYCDIGEWGFRSCDLISGKDGEIGAVRTIGHSVIVGQTRYSDMDTQPLRGTGLYPMYHGTLEARPLGSARTTLDYTLVWDSSTQPDDSSRQKQVKTYRLLFEEDAPQHEKTSRRRHPDSGR